MDRHDARHLLMRTGWTPEPADIARIAAMTRPQAVDALLSGVRTEPSSMLPAWHNAMPPGRRKRKDRAVRKRVRQMGKELKTWWLREMMQTPSPLTEKLVLFWHGHFTSGLRIVRWAPAMLAQNRLFRCLGAGDFRALLAAVLRDPAMLRYLDNHRNRRGRPNENLARELLELFTLGEGRYTERDIKELARALTGAGIDRDTAHYTFRPRAHDFGTKTILGFTGAFEPDDVAPLLCRLPRVSEHIVARLWLFFVGDRPEKSAVSRIAAKMRASGWQIRVALRELLLTDAFWRTTNRAARVKSPVELVVGIGRVAYLRDDAVPKLVGACRALGQDLLDPPSVKGWPTGNGWLDPQRLLLRQRMLGRIAGSIGDDDLLATLLNEWAGRSGLPASLAVIADTVLACPPVTRLPRRSALAFTRALAVEPALQLT